MSDTIMDYFGCFDIPQRFDGCSDGLLPPPITSTPCRTINAASLSGVEIPPREWLVEDWVQMGVVTALYGNGGVGKSLIAMQLMTCAAKGIPFLGIPTTKCNSFGFFCEDSEEELHRRQKDINSHYGCAFPELSGVSWQSRVGFDNVLMSFVRDGIGSPTAAAQLLRDEVIKLDCRLVIIDTAADTFGGNENIRPQVRQFINHLSKIALDINGAVILCAHPSAAGLARNDGTGGSTAWNNTVRSRLYISRPITKDGEEIDDPEVNNLREFTKMKSNYSSVGDKISIVWERGAFKVEGGNAPDLVSRLEADKQNRQDEEKFLEILAVLDEQGKVVSESIRAANYAPKIMIKMEAAKGITFKRLERAIQRLFDSGKIKRGMSGSGKDRHRKEGIIRC